MAMYKQQRNTSCVSTGSSKMKTCCVMFILKSITMHATTGNNLKTHASTVARQLSHEYLVMFSRMLIIIMNVLPTSCYSHHYTH